MRDIDRFALRYRLPVIPVSPGGRPLAPYAMASAEEEDIFRWRRRGCRLAFVAGERLSCLSVRTGTENAIPESALSHAVQEKDGKREFFYLGSVSFGKIALFGGGVSAIAGNGHIVEGDTIIWDDSLPLPPMPSIFLLKDEK